jgi:hypothetical protein
MKNYSDSDTSSESEYNSDGGSAAVSDCDEDKPSQDLDLDQDLEPEPSEDYEEYRNTLWNPDAQIQAQLDDSKLAQLHADIKAQAEIPVNPTYLKLFRSWPFWPFDVSILPDYIQHPIHYFELFWGPEV